MGYTPEEHAEEMARRAARAFEPEALQDPIYKDSVLELASDIKTAIGIEVDLYLLQDALIEISRQQFEYLRTRSALCTHVQIPVRTREDKIMWLDIVETTPDTLEINPVAAPEDPSEKVVML